VNPPEKHLAGRPGAERTLVAAAQAGDRVAFEQLVQRDRARLLRVLVRITRSPETAEDALQDALLRAWRNLPRFNGRSSFFTWLTRIAINEAYRLTGRSQAKATLPLDDAIGERIPNWGGRPDEIFESREFLSAIDRALGRLPLDYRQAVVLRDVEGLSTREAADALGIEERALKSRLHRGRMALRRQLDSFFDR
jgi:RNA polymerase sigma-70 factor (ECF subfamily)